MIKYALVCEFGHDFEGWFGASADYDEQADRGLLACPICASNSIRKQIMAPAVTGARKQGANDTPAQAQAMMMEVMTRVRRHVQENFDYVGNRFSEEARLIHEGKSDERGIYGEASPAEVKALVADGIPVAPLPAEPPKKEKMN